MSKNKNRIVLIRPTLNVIADQFNFPIGLGYLASILRENGYWVRIFDLSLYNISNNDFLDFIEKFDLDYIGITSLTIYYNSTIKLCKEIKKRNSLSKIPLILGGVHASSLPQQTLIDTESDYIVIGEGELTIVKLLDQLGLGKSIEKVDGIAFFKNSQYFRTKRHKHTHAHLKHCTRHGCEEFYGLGVIHT